MARPAPGLAQAAAAYHAPLAEPAANGAGNAAGAEDGAGRLGHAKAQLHGTYIVAQTPDSLVIVDQHAAHERLVYERMKAALADGGVAGQGLLLPEVVEIDPADAERVMARAAELRELGLVLESFGARRRAGAGRRRPSWAAAMPRGWCATWRTSWRSSSRPSP